VFADSVFDGAFERAAMCILEQFPESFLLDVDITGA
jgi:hypothetical protein